MRNLEQDLELRISQFTEKEQAAVVWTCGEKG